MLPRLLRPFTATAALTLAIGAHAQVGPGPDQLLPLPAVPVPAGNPQSAAKIALGQTLFWDEQLSKTGTMACGSCHAPTAGGSDPRLPALIAQSRHPGPDGVLGTADDVTGSLGVPLHDATGRYLGSPVFGVAAQVGNRQSISAVNAAYATRLFWDGRAAGVFTDPATGQVLLTAGGALENQALGPLVNSSEMAHQGGTLADMQARIAAARPLKLASNLPATLSAWIGGRGYPELFAEAYGSAEITASRIAMAMAAYQRTLVSDQTPHDRNLRGDMTAMTPAEMQGRQVFLSAGCQRCHGGALLSDNNFHYIGVRPQAADPGRFTVTAVNGDRGRMRTPMLRNIALSAPYMADGRFATLEEVVDFYNRGGDFTAPNLAPQMAPLGLSPGQRAQLVTFLRRPLTDPRLLDESGPFDRPTLYTESGAAPVAVGSAIGGSAGSPRLIALEAPLAGEPDFTVAADRAAPQAAARILLTLTESSSPEDSALLRVDASIGSNGVLSQDLSLPNSPALADRDLYLRVWIADPTAAGGWSATGSVRFRLLGVPADAVFADAFEPR
ncbi:MAG: hypothetical protein MUE46_07460 [Xanthomonadales bacterium]|nr:hypothetical protein [Xanthomonadales bacterium]